MSNSIAIASRLLVLSIILTGCQGAGKEMPSSFLHRPVPITRTSDDCRFVPPPPLPQPLPHYPWQRKTENYYAITKYHFRCRGDWKHSLLPTEREGKKIYLTDCGGVDSHSLPLREGKEFIYPILIELLNYIQQKSGHRVNITSGHRCPEHNVYMDPLGNDPYSKHMIGAAVDFYVEGRTQQPQKIVEWIQEYYRSQSDTKDKEEFTLFQRYHKEDTDVSTPPWYNKEVFIKLYLPYEGRDSDNDHTYPYISIQVRWDRATREKVTYSWQQAFGNFYRW